MNECFFAVHDARTIRKAQWRGEECDCSWSVVSPYGTAGGGVRWFAALLRAEKIALTRAIIDCGEHRGMVLEALAAGFVRIVLAAPPDSLRSLASAHEAMLLEASPQCAGCCRCANA